MSLRFENPVYKSSVSSQILSEILIRKKAPFEEDSYCSFSVDSILGDAGELKATTASRDFTEIEEEAAEEELPDFFSSMTTCM
jgi:flagellar motor switch protein FliM